MPLFPSWFKTAIAESRGLRSSKTLPSTEFAFRLFEALIPGEQNLAICPYGARIALGMAWEGATGETRRELTQGLGFDENPDNVANQYERRGRPLAFQTDAESRGLELLTANAVWCDQEFTPKETYAATLKKDFLAEIASLDFRAAESAGTVNRWAREKTRGRIPRVVGSLENLSPIALLNAVYFKGFWVKPFEKERTKEEEFTLPDGRKEIVPMMRQSGEYPYTERDGAQIVRLPYHGRMGMCVVLPPKRTEFKKFCSELRSTVGTEWTLGMGRREGHVQLPRFRMETSADLIAPLRAMGISQMFDPGRAALGGISDRKPLYVMSVLQADFVEVNEKGTEAAAVTMLDLAAGVAPTPPPPFEMIVNRPFVFAICDDLTGTVLFLGAVVDPLESGPAEMG